MNPSNFIYTEKIFGKKYHTHNFVSFKELQSDFKKLENPTDCYCSSFLFSKDILDYVKQTGSEAQYPGSCFTEFIRWDIDKNKQEKALQDNIAEALQDARKLIEKLRNFGIEDKYIRCYFTGMKGFNVETSSRLFDIEPSERLNEIIGRMALKIADGIDIDTKIYDKVRFYRIPNSIHGETKWYKIPLTVKEIFSLNEGDIIGKAESGPKPFPDSFKLDSITPQEPLVNLYHETREELLSNPPPLPNEPIDSSNPPKNTKLCYWKILIEGVDKTNPGRHICALRLAKFLKLDMNYPDDICFAMLQRWDSKNRPPLQSEGKFKGKEISNLILNATKYNYGCNDSILSSYCDERCFIHKRKNETTQPLITAKELEDLKLPEETPIIEKGIMPAQSGIIIAGSSEIGKSLLILELAIRLCVSMDFLDFNVPQPRRVLIVQKENALRSVQYRTRKIREGLGLTKSPDNLYMTSVTEHFNLMKPDDLKRLATHIEDAKAELCILDPLSSFHTRDENDNMAMRNVLDNLTGLSRSLGCAFAVVHHYGKQAEYRGASSIKDWADTFIGYEEQYHIQRILRRVKFMKVRNGPRPRPITIERDYSNFTHKIIDEDTICPPDKVREILEEIGGRVESKKALIDEIVNQMDCCGRTARRAVDKAINDKIIMVQKDGKKKTIVLPGD